MSNTAVQGENCNVYFGNDPKKLGMIVIPYMTEEEILGLPNKSDKVKNQLNEERKNLQKLKIEIIRLTNAIHSNQFGDAIPILLNDSFLWVSKSLKTFKVDQTLTFKIEWVKGKNREVSKSVVFNWAQVLKLQALRDTFNLVINDVVVENTKTPKVEARPFAELFKVE